MRIQWWRSHGQEARRGEAGWPRITRNDAAIGSFPLTSLTMGSSLGVGSCLSGATPRRHGRDGLRAPRMAMVYTFCEPSLGRHEHRECMRSAVLDLTLFLPPRVSHQGCFALGYRWCHRASGNQCRPMCQYTPTQGIHLDIRPEISGAAESGTWLRSPHGDNKHLETYLTSCPYAR